MDETETKMLKNSHDKQSDFNDLHLFDSIFSQKYNIGYGSDWTVEFSKN